MKQERFQVHLAFRKLLLEFPNVARQSRNHKVAVHKAAAMLYKKPTPPYRSEKVLRI